eukprot:ANDGO_01887.mRNA.1 hypothetical protein
MDKNKRRWYNELVGNYSVPSASLKPTHHAIQRARERGIPVEELSKRNSYINAFTDRVVSNRPNGATVVLTAYARKQKLSREDHRRKVAAQTWSAHARQFRIPEEEIPRLIGTQGSTIKELQRRYKTQNVNIMFADAVLHVDPGKENFSWQAFRQEFRRLRIHVNLVDALRNNGTNEQNDLECRTLSPEESTEQ